MGEVQDLDMLYDLTVKRDKYALMDYVVIDRQRHATITMVASYCCALLPPLPPPTDMHPFRDVPNTYA